MKDTALYTEDEMKLFEAIESGNYDTVDEKTLYERKRYYAGVAKHTIEKMTRKKSLNLRVYESDIPSIKSIALGKGIPYQTLLSSIIHRVATREIEI